MKNIREIEGNLSQKNNPSAASSLKGGQIGQYHQYGKYVNTSQPVIEGGRRSEDSTNFQINTPYSPATIE
jgi:hypothetical protein